jgi:hypothetical protein
MIRNYLQFHYITDEFEYSEPKSSIKIMFRISQIFEFFSEQECVGPFFYKVTVYFFFEICLL